MTKKRRIEVFSANCPLCTEAVSLVEGLACPSCEITVVDMHTPAGAARARDLGVASVPAVAVDGTLAGCCAGRGVDPEVLRAAGLGRPAGEGA